MRPHILDALTSFALVSGATTLATIACSSEDPAPAPGGTTTQTTTATGTGQGMTSTAAGPTTASNVTSTGTSGGTTGSATGVGGGTATASATSVGGASSTTASATTGDVATSAGGSSTGTATATTDGGATLTDEQCQGISNDDPCTTPGTCAPRACGLADTGTRTCTCATTWDCTSCSWTEPYADVAVPPESALPACAADVADEVACTTKGDRCMQADEVCACWLEEDAVTIWDCDSPPSFWP